MRNIKLSISYDGTCFHGFGVQRGSGLRTVQGVLSDALASLAGRPVAVIGAGRTDAGVHARAQVVNFDAQGWPCPIERVVSAINGVLPDDLAVLKAEEVPPEFHARFSATSKIYRYTVYNHPVRFPLLSRYSYHEGHALDVRAMTEGISHLIGTHDFASFQASGRRASHTVRHLFRATVNCSSPLIMFTFEADGFLYNMVRILVGTLLWVGRSKIPAGKIPEILASGDRKMAGPTAPPQGLCLEEVRYGPAKS